ncbi:MAG: glutathione peroxidase [Chitinophagales bacterium]
MNTTSFYELEATDLSGKTVPMSRFKGKTIIVVNTASKCGLTPQYGGLEALYQKYKDRGLVILGFPCNQFGEQEPGTSEEISQFCSVNYGVSFPMFSKIDVNGAGAHPVFVYLKKESGGWLSKLTGTSIKWNFTKFLIDKSGKPVKRFEPISTPAGMAGDIEKIL